VAIQELEIRGFRSFREAIWRPGALTLVVGPNGSGKSNLLRLLEFVSNVARGRLAKSVSEAGGMVPLSWDHKTEIVAWKLRIDPVDDGRDRAKVALTYELALHRAGSAYEIQRDSLGNWQEYNETGQGSPYWVFNRSGQHVHIYDQRASRQRLVDLHVRRFDANESLLSQIGDFRNRIPSYARDALGSWGIHHDVPVGSSSRMRAAATTQHVTRLDPDGGNLTTVLHTLCENNREFEERVSDAMFAAFGDEFRHLKFPPVAAQQIQLAIQWNSSSAPHAGQDLSDGTLRFLFLIAVLSQPDPPSVIAIDEPEVGLHPRMLPIVAEYAASAAQRTQVILTSHSPEFLDAFSETAASVTVCQWEEGQTRLFALEEGRYREWLKRYRLGELFTSGELDLLASPPVEEPEDMSSRLEGLAQPDRSESA
jgi:predicted ATPase